MARVSRTEGEALHCTLGHATVSARTTVAAAMRSIFSSVALFLSCAEALYFYIDGPTQKCFFEELPKDTLVVGELGDAGGRAAIY